MPITIASWLRETSLPRTCAGATSAMYIGERFEARPIATPPASRHRTKLLKVLAAAIPRDETAKKNAATVSRVLRPNLSLRLPETSAPTKHPTRAQLIAQPCCDASRKWKNLS